MSHKKVECYFPLNPNVRNKEIFGFMLNVIIFIFLHSYFPREHLMMAEHYVTSDFM